MPKRKAANTNQNPSKTSQPNTTNKKKRSRFSSSDKKTKDNTASSRKRPRDDSKSTTSTTSTELTSSKTTSTTTTTTTAPPPRIKKSRFTSSSATAPAAPDKLALLALIQQRAKSLEVDLPSLINKTGVGLASAPELVLDKNGKDVATTSVEAAKILREHASLKINRDVARKKAVNPYLAHRQTSFSTSSSSSSFFSSSSTVIDHRVKSDRVSRTATRDFKFVKAGALVARAERLKKSEAKAIQGGKVGKTLVHEDQDVHSNNADNNNNNSGASSAASEKMLDISGKTMKETLQVAPISKSMTEDAIRSETVGCEWWDVPYLATEKGKIAKDMLRHRASSSSSSSSTSSSASSSSLSTTELFPCTINDFDIEHSKTWKLIQKPEMLVPVGEPIDPGPQPVRLTQKERKKIRRRNRAEKQMEEQDKIRLGIIDAPAPKVKMSNLHRVLGNEAVMDPSKVEKEMREGKQQRELDHEMRNLQAKKTPAEAREKLTKKLKGDRELAEKTGINVAVFKITGELLDATKRFKIDMNARQLYLTGVCLIVHDDTTNTTTVPTNMVVVEGGKKGIKSYKKLLLRRIKWGQDHAAYQLDEQRRLQNEADGEDVGEEEDEERAPLRHSKFPMTCSLLWEGVVSEPHFKQFRLEECKNSRVARSLCKNNKYEHYWNMTE